MRMAHSGQHANSREETNVMALFTPRHDLGVDFPVQSPPSRTLAQSSVFCEDSPPSASVAAATQLACRQWLQGLSSSQCK